MKPKPEYDRARRAAEREDLKAVAELVAIVRTELVRAKLEVRPDAR